jgi:hypothetical protein
MVATRPGGAPAPDAFVPCPVCGGKIHPIAGRCKHCKSDLVALRAAQAVPAAVPAIASAPAYAPATPVAPITGAAVQSAPIPQAQGTLPASGPLNAAAFAPVGLTAMPVPTSLPQLGSSYAQAGVPSAGVVVRGSQWSRRWPIVVVVLAAAAIVVSIVLLVMPESASAGSQLRGAPPPTPDHMNTNPIPQGPDPWGMAPPAQPAPPAPSDPDDDDLWGPRGGTGGLGTGGLGGGTIPAPPEDQFLATLGKTFCHRLTACANTGLSADDCDQFGSFLASSVLPGVSMCSSYDRRKASSCLTSLSRFPCSTGTLDQDQMKALVAGFPDCIDACRP